jgi:hypothetical protein
VIPFDTLFSDSTRLLPSADLTLIPRMIPEMSSQDVSPTAVAGPNTPLTENRPTMESPQQLPLPACPRLPHRSTNLSMGGTWDLVGQKRWRDEHEAEGEMDTKPGEVWTRSPGREMDTKPGEREMDTKPREREMDTKPRERDGHEARREDPEDTKSVETLTFESTRLLLRLSTQETRTPSTTKHHDVLRGATATTRATTALM